MNFGGAVKLNPVGIFVLLGLTFIFLLYIIARKPEEKEINLKHLLIAAINVAEKGGEVVKAKSILNVNKKIKGQTDEGVNEFVTDADYHSHCLMYSNLFYSFPYLKVISEEMPPVGTCDKYLSDFEQIIPVSSNDARISEMEDLLVPIEDVTIWIDPLDATQEYTEHLTNYVTTMVCVAVKGKPLIGVIHQPFEQIHSGSTTWGWVEKGTSSNIKVKETIGEKLKIIISRSHSGHVKNIINNAFPEAEIVAAGGSGYKVLQLLNGNESAYIHSTKIKKWDVCAGNAILLAVGGRMSTIDNDEINYFEEEKEIQNGILATVFKHNWFHDKLKENGV